MAHAVAGSLGHEGSPLLLSQTKPLFTGVKRIVFQHPQHPGLLIKVIREDYAAKKFGPKGSFHNRRRRCRHYNVFLRELREYLVACARSAECLPFLAEVVGLVHTDLGLGLVVEKVCGPDGGPAPTLYSLVEQGAMDPSRRDLLDRLLEALVASDVVVDDMHPGNVVLSVDSSGSERFVLIDGIGSSTFIPLKALLRPFNQRSKRRECGRLRVYAADNPQKIPWEW